MQWIRRLSERWFHFISTLTPRHVSHINVKRAKEHKNTSYCLRRGMIEFWLQQIGYQQSVVSLKQILSSGIYWDSGKAGLTFFWIWKSEIDNPQANPPVLKVSQNSDLVKTQRIDFGNGPWSDAWMYPILDDEVFWSWWCAWAIHTTAAYDPTCFTNLVKTKAGCFDGPFLFFYVVRSHRVSVFEIVLVVPTPTFWALADIAYSLLISTMILELT